MVVVMWVVLKKTRTQCQGVRKILFSDTHSGVCGQEHLPFRKMNILVHTTYMYEVSAFPQTTHNKMVYVVLKRENLNAEVQHRYVLPLDKCHFLRSNFI